MENQKFSIQKYKSWLSEIDYNKNF